MSDWFAFPSTACPKIWVDEKDAFANALCLYQPASRVGKAVRHLIRILPDYLSKIFYRGMPDKAQKSELEILSEGIKKILRLDNPVISFSTGTPGSHRKMTAQVSQQGEIQAYIKIGRGTDVINLLLNEENILRQLEVSELAATQIPRVLHSAWIGDYYAIFLSSPNGCGKQSPLNLDEKVIGFLVKLGASSIQTHPVGNVLSKMGVIGLISRLTQSDPSTASILQNAINYIKSSLADNTVRVSPCHGDYAPWNTLRLGNNELYLYDWEYFDDSAPCLVDLFNWEFMRARLVKKQKEAAVIQHLLGMWDDPVCKRVVESIRIPYAHAHAYIILYLLYMIAREAGSEGSPSLYMLECVHKALVYANYNGYSKKVLVSAYACEPDKGSEPGVGWHWVDQISRANDVWVITRKNNQYSIERELQINPRPNLHFVYVDLPRWLAIWKKGRRGVRTYYYFWQYAALIRGIALHRHVKFDVGHHITFVNDWLWSFMSCIPVPFVWGPIGSNAPCPKALLISNKDRILENIRILVQATVRVVDPLYWLTAIRAGVVLIINEKIGRDYPLSWLSRGRFETVPAIGMDAIDRQGNDRAKNTFTALFVGRFQYVKCPHLAVESFAKLSKLRANAVLMMVGTGPKEQELKKLVEDLKIPERVNFIGWSTRDEILEFMCKADVFLYPSAEGAGMVVLEAMACGLPTICLEFGGPGELVGASAGMRIPVTTHDEIVEAMARSMVRLCDDKELLEKISQKAVEEVNSKYLWDCKAEVVRRAYERSINYYYGKKKSRNAACR